MVVENTDKLGEKTNILASRVMDLVDGLVVVKEMLKGQVIKTGNPQHQQIKADNLSASALGILPQGPPGLPNSLSTTTGNQVVQQQQQPRQQMAQQNQPPMGMMNEPMAANEMPSGAFSNVFG